MNVIVSSIATVSPTVGPSVSKAENPMVEANFVNFPVLVKNVE